MKKFHRGKNACLILDVHWQKHFSVVYISSVDDIFEPSVSKMC